MRRHSSRRFGRSLRSRCWERRFRLFSYFEDAESDPPLAMLTEISWTEIKNFFNREAPALL